MPIANCFLAPNCPSASGDIIKLWAIESKLSDKHMTVNFIDISQQYGNQYLVMANLALPSLWSRTDTSLLQLGLSSALQKTFKISTGKIQIITSIVHSGMVVESGAEVTWK